MCSSTHQNIEDVQRSASFSSFFKELETQVLYEANFAIKNITLGLINRRNLGRGIICKESNLNKITLDITMWMFTVADLRLEFEMKAQLF